MLDMVLWRMVIDNVFISHPIPLRLMNLQWMKKLPPLSPVSVLFLIFFFFV